MKTLMTVLLVVVLGLFGLSVLSIVAAVLLPKVHVTHAVGEGIMQPWGHHGMLFGAPMGNMFSGFTGLLIFAALIVAAALALRSILDRRGRRESDGADPRPPGPRSNIEMDEMVRDLQYTAKKLEERLEALETILLEHGRPRR